MQYKLLALDMDGTLLTKSKKIHKDDLQAIKVYTELGGKVIISTGRHINSLKKYIQQINEYTGYKIPYIITLNGAEIYNENFECIYSKYIEKATVSVINEILEKYKIYYLCYPIKKDNDDDPIPLINLRILKLFCLKYRVKPKFQKGYYEGDLYKYNVGKINRKIVTKAINEINEKLGDKVNVFPHDVYFFEISPSGVNKGEAIKFVAKRLDILMNHVAACGDTANDIDGFKACKLSAAIRTFNPTVIANASVHIKKSRAGVSEFIYKYLIQDVPKVKMVVTDLDGTLYTNNEKNIVKETIDVINKAVPDKIQYFCIASGRSAADTYRAIEQLGVKNDKNMFIVGVNGAAVYDVEHRREIYSTWLKYTDVKMLFKLYERISKEIPMGVIIHNYDKDKTIETIKTKGEVIPKMYCKNRPFIIKQLQALSKGFFTKYNRMENYHELEGCPTWLTVSKIIFQFDNPEDRAKAFKIVDSMHLPLSISRSVGKNIEFNNPTINKAVGLKKLCEYLHIEPNETLVCGDEGNDKPMMKLTEWSYCLAISSQDVKDSCKFVLDSKPSYFVGEAINEYLKTIGEK